MRWAVIEVTHLRMIKVGNPLFSRHGYSFDLSIVSVRRFLKGVLLSLRCNCGTTMIVYCAMIGNSKRVLPAGGWAWARRLVSLVSSNVRVKNLIQVLG